MMSMKFRCVPNQLTTSSPVSRAWGGARPSGPAGPVTVEAGGTSLGGRSGPPPRTVVDKAITKALGGAGAMARVRTTSAVTTRSIDLDCHWVSIDRPIDSSGWL